ncbi:MAG: LacI family DNA-binding transcriptional regulator [Candidatus Caldatribacteriaceae bacterium]
MRQRMHRVTMKDVAKEAGVTLSTVSHFLNGTAPVVPKTRQKIVEAIKRLNYRPDLTARNLKKCQTKALGLFVPDITNSFYAELARGVADVARESGYSVILYATSYERELEQSFVGLVEQRQVDGVIVSYSFLDESLWGRLLECGIPLVLVDVYPVNTIWPSVVVNNEKGIELALSYLVSLGHTRIAYLSEPPYVLSLVKRQRAFLQFVRKKNLPVKDKWILVEKAQRNRVEIGFGLGKRLIGEQDIPTAVVASSDLVAVGVVKAFLSSGVRVPEDVSVVGFDDILLASYIHPSLTTVRQPKYEMGRIGVEFLV